MKKTLECLKISWEGPFTAEDVVSLNKDWDYGIYQIYGTHNIFGADSLLYIGKAMEQTFADRIVQHEHWIQWESEKGSQFTEHLSLVVPEIESSRKTLVVFVISQSLHTLPLQTGAISSVRRKSQEA